MKYYIDFDNTLYSTSSLKNKMLEGISKVCAKQNTKMNYDNILFECKQIFCREKIYNIYELCEYLGQKYGINSKLLSEEVNKIIKHGSIFVYEDVSNFLLKLKNAGETLILLTQTTEDNLAYQRLKIDGCGLRYFFDDIIFTTTNKYTLSIDYQNTTFIDDNPTELLGLCKAGAKTIIRVMRRDCKYSNIKIPSNKIFEITCFEELDTKLKQKSAHDT